MAIQHSVRTRLLFILLTTALLFLVFLFSIYWWNSLRLDSIVAERSSDFQLSLDRVIARNGESLESVVQNYSFWDDLYERVTDFDQEWVQENIDQSVPIFGVENAWIIGLQGEVIHQFSLVKDVLFMPISLEALVSMDMPDGLHAYYQYEQAGDRHVAEFRALPIHRTQDKSRVGANAGWFVVARTLDEEYFETTSEEMSAQVKLVFPADHQYSRNNEWYLISSYSLPGIDNKNEVAIIQASVDMLDLEQVSNAALWAFLLSSLFLLFFIVINYFFLGLIIINPIRAMNKAMNQDSIVPIEPYLNQNNEIGRLSRLIVQFYRQRQSLADDNKRQELAIEDMELTNQTLYKSSRTDALTQLSNRRGFDEYFERSWHSAYIERVPLSVIFADIDYFKSYNDSYGHQKGDEVLQRVAEIMSGSLLRQGDLLARYGGEEFVVVCTNTDEIGARVLAERIRQKVFDADIEHHFSSLTSRITLSLGVSSCIPGLGHSREDLLSVADRCLYKAKDAGRNCVVSGSGDLALG